jgi:hypothetical protein
MTVPSDRAKHRRGRSTEVDRNTTSTALAGWPPTRFAPWRLRSQVCVPVDWLVGAAGAILIVLPGLDSVLSWPTNNVIVDPATLVHLSTALLLSCWPWIIVSGWMVTGRQGAKLPFAPAPKGPWKLTVFCFAVLAVVVLVVIVVGLAMGGAKGSSRVLPNDVYQISSIGGPWTTVPSKKYDIWTAELVRLDALFALFGLLMAGFALLMHYLRWSLRPLIGKGAGGRA